MKRKLKTKLSRQFALGKSLWSDRKINSDYTRDGRKANHLSVYPGEHGEKRKLASGRWEHASASDKVNSVFFNSRLEYLRNRLDDDEDFDSIKSDMAEGFSDYANLQDKSNEFRKQDLLQSSDDTRRFAEGLKNDRIRSKPYDVSRNLNFAILSRQRLFLRKFYGNYKEQQFKKLYLKVNSGSTTYRKRFIENSFINQLERRLDVVVYRLFLAPTIFAARQLILHRKIFVNKQLQTAPSMLVKNGDLIEGKQDTQTRLYHRFYTTESLLKKKRELKAKLENFNDSSDSYQIESIGSLINDLYVPYLLRSEHSMGGIFIQDPKVEDVSYANANIVDFADMRRYYR
jgi:ribosomal protein S4